MVDHARNAIATFGICQGRFESPAMVTLPNDVMELLRMTYMDVARTKDGLKQLSIGLTQLASAIADMQAGRRP
jgi:hypothetical protein